MEPIIKNPKKRIFTLGLILLIILIFILKIERGTKPENSNQGQSANNITNNSNTSIQRLSSRRVIVDRFNNLVTNEMRENQNPQRGGTLRVRLPGNPVNLNQILSSTATANMISGYINDSLINRDPETLEYRPWIAKYWEVRDFIELNNGQIITGKIIAKTDTSFTIAPIKTLTFAKADTKKIDKQKGILILKNGTTYKGKIKTFQYTAVIKTNIKGQKTRKLGLFEIKKTIKKNGNKKITVPLALKNSVFIFHIRKGVKWQGSNTNPQYLTADDILFSYKTIMNPYVNAQRLRAYYNEIYKVDKLNNYSIRFLYSKPYFSAFDVCAGIPIIPKHKFKGLDFQGDKVSFGKSFNKHVFNRNPIGLGPYKLSKWDFSKVVILERFNDYWACKANLPYWNPKQPYLDKIMFVIVGNSQSALKALLKKEIDLDAHIEPSMWFYSETRTASFRKAFVRARDAGLIYTYIGWNAKTVFFKDPRVRRAMTMLIPREKILKQIHFGLGKITTGPFYPKSPVYDHTINAYRYNPELAIKLLDEAGWIDSDGDGIREKNGVKFQFEYLIHNMRDYHQRIADIIKEHVEQAGIKMLIRKLDWSIFIRRVSQQRFDAVRLAWGVSVDPDPYQVWHSSQSKGRGSNYINFENAMVDQILEDGRQTFNQEKRWAMYRKFHRILHKEQPYTFLFNLNSLIFYNKKFRGVKLYYSSTPFNFNEWYYTGGSAQIAEKDYNYYIVGIILLLLIGGAIFFFTVKMKNIFNNKP